MRHLDEHGLEVESPDLAGRNEDNLRMMPATPNTATPNTATPNTATPSTATPNTATPNTATPNTATPNTATPRATLAAWRHLADLHSVPVDDGPLRDARVGYLHGLVLLLENHCRLRGD